MFRKSGEQGLPVIINAIGPSDEEILSPYDQTPKHGRYLEAPDSCPGPPVGLMDRLAADGAIGDQVTEEVIRLRERGSWPTGTGFITEQDRAIISGLGGPALQGLLETIK